MRRVVPLRHHGKHVGTAVIEVDQEGCRVISTDITDPEVKRMFEEDILRMEIPGGPREARKADGAQNGSIVQKED